MLIYTKQLSALCENSYLIEYSTIGYIFLASLVMAYIQNNLKENALQTLRVLDDAKSKYGIPNSPKTAATVFLFIQYKIGYVFK